jgi:uncharacterized membrane protein (TIGR02234 family)
MRSQRLVDLLALVALVLLGLAAYLNWTIADPGKGRALVNFNGNDVTRAPVTLALAALVAVIVTKLAGTALRRVLAALLVVLGVAAIAVALQVRPDAAELARLRPELSQAVTDSVSLSTGPAPWLALAGGIALVAAGIVAAVTAHRWRRATQRYERDPAVTPADQWKAIDAGEDPTV